MSYSFLWQTSANGSAWSTMKTPSSYKISWEDLDVDSSRSVVDGSLSRNIIGKKWCKVEMDWPYLTDSEYKTLAEAVNSAAYFRFRSPAFGDTTDNWVSFAGYVSKMSTEMLQGQMGWSLSFNVVQAQKGSWQ